MFAIYTDDGLDQVVETLTLAKKEVKDLKKMGCGGVRYKKIKNEDEA